MSFKSKTSKIARELYKEHVKKAYVDARAIQE